MKTRNKIKIALMIGGMILSVHSVAADSEHKDLDFNNMINSTSDESKRLNEALNKIYPNDEASDDKAFIQTEMNTNTEKPAVVDSKDEKQTTVHNTRGPSSLPST